MYFIRLPLRVPKWVRIHKSGLLTFAFLKRCTYRLFLQELLCSSIILIAISNSWHTNFKKVREPVSGLFEDNWINICSVQTREMGRLSFELELNMLTIIKKNIFHKPPPHVVEVTPASYVLAN